MKYLQDYIQDEQSKLLEDLGAFFAFNREQFEEGAAKVQAKKPEGTKWASVGMGMFMPSVNVEEFKRRHSELVAAGMRQDLEKNGRRGVILRELNNYECFYSGDMTPAIEALEDYGITADEVRAVYRSPKAVKVGV
ncbi:hypothetical protein G6024_01155 [Dietzia maris]|nr:hypothetical protein [Dietzia maris]MBB0995730.1 hypothetical protein [Dietzia maris]